MTVDELMSLPMDKYFEYVQSIRYGYADRIGRLHFPNDNDFYCFEYGFSLPEDIIRNRCAWCWDISFMTCEYCEKNAIEYRHIFLEYRDGERHQTHTQVIFKHGEKWYAAPDNSTEERFDARPFDSECDCIKDFTEGFEGYLRYRFKDAYDRRFFICKEITVSGIRQGATDEEVLLALRTVEN